MTRFGSKKIRSRYPKLGFETSVFGISGPMDSCDFGHIFKDSVFGLRNYDASETAMPRWEVMKGPGQYLSHPLPSSSRPVPKMTTGHK